MGPSICIRCALSRSIIPTRSSLKRTLYTTRALRKDGDAPADPSAGTPTTPAKTPRPKKSLEERSTKKFSAADIKTYTAEQKAELAKKYTPAQLASIEAGEAAVSPDDMFEQGALRTDPFALPYHTDDLSQIMPVIDKPIIAPEENYDPNMRFKTSDEIASDLADYVKNAPENADQVHYKRFIDGMRLKVGKEEAERNPPRYVAPAIPKGIPALQMAVTKSAETDVDPGLKRLMKQTGFNTKAIRSFRVRHLVQHRVVNQTRLGKIQSIYFLTIAGNQQGLLGIGEGKSTEAEDARKQAHYNAIRMMQPVPRYEQRTIFGDIRVKMGAVELELMTRPPGTFSLYILC